MHVSNPFGTANIAAYATQKSTEQVQQVADVRILKKALDTSKLAAELLVDTLDATNVGQNIDITA